MSDDHKEAPVGRFGVSAQVLERARILRDTVFPEERVSLFICQGKAYVVTTERQILLLDTLEGLAQKTNDEVRQLIRETIAADPDHVEEW